jgi:hypothetical protein
VEHRARLGIHDVPVLFLETGQIDRRPVRRDRHPVRPALVLLLPHHLLGREIDALHRLEIADVDAVRREADRDSLDVGGVAGGRHAPVECPRLLAQESGCRDSLHEAVAVVDVEDQEPVPAMFQIPAETRDGDVQQALDVLSSRRLRGAACGAGSDLIGVGCGERWGRQGRRRHDREGERKAIVASHGEPILLQPATGRSREHEYPAVLVDPVQPLDPEW